jgi:hypothetical protein
MYVIVKTISEREKLSLCVYYGRILPLNNMASTQCKRWKITVLYHIYMPTVFNNNVMLIFILPPLHNMNAVCNMPGLTIISVPKQWKKNSHDIYCLFLVP